MSGCVFRLMYTDLEMMDELPTSKEYLDRFYEQVVAPGMRKESGMVFCLPGIGRNSLIRYLAHFGIKKNEQITLIVDSDEEEKIKSLWRAMLMEQNLGGKENWENMGTDEILLKLVELGKRILLAVYMTEDGPSITRLSRYRNLQSMYIDFNFGIIGEAEALEVAKGLGELGRFAIQNQWVMPLLDKESSEKVIQNQIKSGFVSVSKEQTEKIIGLAGGYVSLIRFYLRNLELVDEEVIDNPEVKYFFEGIWESLADESRLWLFDFASKKEIGNPSKFLVESGIVNLSAKQKLFSKVFEEYLDKLLQKKVPEIKMVGEILTVGNQRVETLLSNQEERVMRLLASQVDKIVSRDEVAEAIWGKLSMDNYSDWAINQIIRRIRVKIGDIREDKKLIETIRGKGFRLQNGE